MGRTRRTRQLEDDAQSAVQKGEHYNKLTDVLTVKRQSGNKGREWCGI